MQTYFIFLISLLLSSIYTFNYEQISLNKSYTFKTEDKPLQFYQISLKDLKTIPNEIKIDTQILDSKNPSSSTIGIHYHPFKKSNINQIKKELLGKQLIINEEFIKSVMTEEQKVFIAIFCEKCAFKLNTISSGELALEKNFIQNGPLRGLIEQNNILNEQINNNYTRINVFRGNGISGLIVAFFMIFVSVIACIIMMNIYVHNTALVEQPLKLGRVEA